MSNATIFCLVFGVGGSINALIAWRTDMAKGEKSLWDYRERFWRLTSPVYPVLLVIGIVGWIRGL